MKNYGMEMKIVRVTLNLTLSEMAERLSIAPATLSNYEKGRIPPADIYDRVIAMRPTENRIAR